MTSPTTPDEEALAFEALVVRMVAGEVLSTLDDAVSMVLTAFEGLSVTVGTITEESAKLFGKVLADRIRVISWDPMEPRAKERAIEARQRGISRVVRTIPPGGERDRAARTKPRRPKALPKMDRNLRRGLEEAAKLAQQGIRTRTQAASVAGKLKAAKARTEGSARWVAHEGLNAGVADVARNLGQRLLWTPERNSCLHCLAHAGWIVEPDDEFPTGRSFDPKGSKLPGVPWPPLHPNCRCEVKLTTEPAGPPPADRSDVSRAAALAREARRSVAYQWTDYASGAAKERAAAALLAIGTGLASSVEKRARAQLRKGGVRRP